MNIDIKINYWWSCEQFPDDIPEPLFTALKESAEKQIFEMTQQGYYSGELIDYVNIDVPGHKSPNEDGYYCRGWFNISRYFQGEK